MSAVDGGSFASTWGIDAFPPVANLAFPLLLSLCRQHFVIFTSFTFLSLLHLTCLRGLVVRRSLLVRKVPGSKSPSIGLAENALCSPSSKWIPDSLQSLGKLGGEGRGDSHHPSHAVPSDTCGTLNFHCPYSHRLWDLPLPLPFYTCEPIFSYIVTLLNSK